MGEPSTPFKDHSSARGERGLAIMEGVLLLPLYLTVVLGLAWLYLYLRTSVVLGSAAEKAAQIAVMREGSLQIENTYSPSAPSAFFPSSHFWDQCRSSADPQGCVSKAAEEMRLSALGWAGSGNTDLGDGVEPQSHFPLPFSLFEEPEDTPGYFPVQTLPLVGIERGCLEVFNETSAFIRMPGRWHPSLVAPSGFDVFGRSPDSCWHQKPLYWQSPIRADFDGDRREDLVLFKPRSSGNAAENRRWGTNVSAAEIDFIVYYSARAYTLANGIGLFNLTTAKTRAEANSPIPVVADYDRDGLADFAIYELESGIFRAALSSMRYRLVVEAQFRLSFSDPDGARGLIAIPGTFQSATDMQLALIATGGDISDRYRVYLTDSISAAIKDQVERGVDFAPYPVLQGSGGVKVKAITLGTTALDPIYSPHRGYASVPAFADYDDSGRVSIGWLSWQGGNLARRVAGAVPAANAPISEKNSFKRLSASPPASSAPLEVPLNPFDITLSDGTVASRRALLVSDAVDGRIWQIESAAGHDQFVFDGSTLSLAVTSFNRSPAPNFPNDIFSAFPRENVWNVPIPAAWPTDSGSGLTAATTVLKLQRRIRAVSEQGRSVVFVADWGNGRILRIEDNDRNGFSPNDPVHVVLGASRCTLEGVCPELFMRTNKPASSSPHGNGELRFFPSALAIVPDLSDPQRYSLAFSAGNEIYLITPSPSALGGPTGDSQEMIYRIAGNGQETLTAPGGNPDAAEARFLDIPALPASANARSAAICPVTDLEFVRVTREGTTLVELVAASSCSLWRTPEDAQIPSRIADQAAGGILRIAPVSSAELFTGENRLRRLAGGFWRNPCLPGNEPGAPGLCAGPASNEEAGIYHRRVDISAQGRDAIASIDLINPVDIEVIPNGFGQEGYPSLMFVDQWNSQPRALGPAYNYPGRTDRQHNQGIYLLERDPESGDGSRIVPITNPLSFGGGTVPVESAHWTSPHSAPGGINTGVMRHIAAHEAPAKNAPIPAAASVLLMQGLITAATPLLQEVTPNHPYSYHWADVGFIYQIENDNDGDGRHNGMDTDTDGDGLPNDSDSARYCANVRIANGGAAACRLQEKIGQPIQYFRKAGLTSPDQIYLPAGNSGDGAPSYYAEFFFANSVSECGSGSDCAAGNYFGRWARQESWATLFNFGDDQDMGREACNSLTANDPSSPYFGCIHTSNGPIAAPQPLSAFVGASDAPALKGYEYFYHTTGVGHEDRGLFLFPLVLSSTMPRENGIKMTRRAARSAKNPGARGNGVLCAAGAEGYSPVRVSLGGDASLSNSGSFGPFSLKTDRFQQLYFGTSLDPSQSPNYSGGPEAGHDNDNLNYYAACDSTGVTGVEGVILQLDHDETSAKSAPDPSAPAPHWPDPFATGARTLPENSRQFLMLDTDGDGAGNPTYLTTDLMGTDFAQRGAFSMISLGLEDPGTSPWHYFEAVDRARRPFGGVNPANNILNALGWVNSDGAYPLLEVRAPLKPNARAGSFSFDLPRETIDGDHTLIAGLDVDVFVSREYGLAVSDKKNPGARGYANYVRSNRFAGDSPALRAGRNILKLSLGAEDGDFASTWDEFSQSDKTIYIGLAGDVSEDAYGNSLVTGCDDAPQSCRNIVVARKLSILGKTYSITRVEELPSDQLDRVLPACDPETESGDCA